jgi:hypothetical protein
MNVFRQSTFALTNHLTDFILKTTATVKRCIFEHNHQTIEKTKQITTFQKGKGNTL